MEYLPLHPFLFSHKYYFIVSLFHLFSPILKDNLLNTKMNSYCKHLIHLRTVPKTGHA